MFLLIFSLICIVYLSFILSSNVKIGGVYMGGRSVMGEEKPKIDKVLYSYSFPLEGWGSCTIEYLD